MNEARVFIETQRWLAYAQKDLQAAKSLLTQPQDFSQQVCFLSQQAAEKSLKAALVFEQINFPFRHDLDLLRNFLPQDWLIHQHVPDLSELSAWAVESRYPTRNEEPTLAEAQAALEMAQTVVDSIQQDLRQRGLAD